MTDVKESKTAKQPKVAKPRPDPIPIDTLRKQKRDFVKEVKNFCAPLRAIFSKKSFKVAENGKDFTYKSFNKLRDDLIDRFNNLWAVAEVSLKKRSHKGATNYFVQSDLFTFFINSKVNMGPSYKELVAGKGADIDPFDAGLDAEKTNFESRLEKSKSDSKDFKNAPWGEFLTAVQNNWRDTQDEGTSLQDDIVAYLKEQVEKDPNEVKAPKFEDPNHKPVRIPASAGILSHLFTIFVYINDLYGENKQNINIMKEFKDKDDKPKMESARAFVKYFDGKTEGLVTQRLSAHEREFKSLDKTYREAKALNDKNEKAYQKKVDEWKESKDEKLNKPKQDFKRIKAQAPPSGNELRTYDWTSIANKFRLKKTDSTRLKAWVKKAFKQKEGEKPKNPAEILRSITEKDFTEKLKESNITKEEQADWILSFREFRFLNSKEVRTFAKKLERIGETFERLDKMAEEKKEVKK